jgi:hypothetical protein
VAAAMVGVARADSTNEIKPAAVLSIAGYDRAAEDVNALGSLQGDENLAGHLEGMLAFMTKGQGLAGLDKTRPCGVFAGTDGEEVGHCVFIPVTDLDKLMSVVKIWTNSRLSAKDENGIYKLRAPKKTVYIQETHKGWAFAVENPEHFQHVPKDPTEWLDGLDSCYDAAVRIYVANLPEKVREDLHAKIKKHVKKMAERHKKKHKGHGFKDCPMAKYMKNHLKEMARDVDNVTVGVTFDSKSKQGVVEVKIAAKPDTALAKHFAQVGAMETAFGGFTLPEPALTARVTSQCPAPPTDVIDKMIEQMRARAYKKIDRKSKSEAHTKVAREIADSLLDVVKKTTATGRHDCAMALALDDDAATLVGGRYVADGPQLEKTVKRFIGELRQVHPEKVDGIVTLDAEKYEGVNLHVAEIPVPDECPNHDKAVKLVGEKMTIVLGVAPKAVYIAAGRDAMASLKKAIDQSLANQKSTSPVQLTLDAGQVIEFLEEYAPPKCREKADILGDAIEKANGADQIRLTAQPGDGVMTLRLELDEGVLRALHVIKQLKDCDD